MSFMEQENQPETPLKKRPFSDTREFVRLRLEEARVSDPLPHQLEPGVSYQLPELVLPAFANNPVDDARTRNIIGLFLGTNLSFAEIGQMMKLRTKSLSESFASSLESHKFYYDNRNNRFLRVMPITQTNTRRIFMRGFNILYETASPELQQQFPLHELSFNKKEHTEKTNKSRVEISFPDQIARHDINTKLVPQDVLPITSKFANQLLVLGVPEILICKMRWVKKYDGFPNAADFGQLLGCLGEIDEAVRGSIVEMWLDGFRERIAITGRALEKELKVTRQRVGQIANEIDPNIQSNWERIEAIRMRKNGVKASKITLSTLAREFYTTVPTVFIRARKKLGIVNTRNLTEADIDLLREDLSNNPPTKRGGRRKKPSFVV